MTARPVVVVAAGSETLVLRLRMMVEAEGAQVAVLGRDAITGAALVLAVPALAGAARGAVPGVPVIELDDNADWEGLGRRLASVLAAASGEVQALAAALSGARILLVDDSVTFREYLRQELVRLGASVSVCGSASDAMAHLTAGGWDCVLVDLVLPGMDGTELCRHAARLRREGRGDYALVVLSSREGRDDLIRSLEAGADIFLGKAQDLAIIRAKLGALLRCRLLRR